MIVPKENSPRARSSVPNVSLVPVTVRKSTDGDRLLTLQGRRSLLSIRVTTIVRKPPSTCLQQLPTTSLEQTFLDERKSPTRINPSGLEYVLGQWNGQAQSDATHLMA